MIDPNNRDRANDILARLLKLDEELQNAWCFRLLIEDLHDRDLEAVPRRHHNPIGVARAAMLRSLIASVMAALDPPDSRGNRASVGQILSALENSAVAVLLVRPRQHETTDAVRSLNDVRSEYDKLRCGGAFADARTLRNDALSHLLSHDDERPTVPYTMIYALHDRADAMTSDLFRLCGRRRQQTQARLPRFRENAVLFWDTYFKGMVA